MAIDTHFERKEEILIGKLDGRIDTTNAEELQSQLDAEIKAEDHALILDFERVSHISSSGLRVVLRMAKRFNNPGKRFAVCSLSESVHAILTMSGFDQLISIFESQSLAIGDIKNR